MPMVVVITRDVEARYKGFLGSTMLEVEAGVFVQPRMSAGVRERIWNVISRWYDQLDRGSILMCYVDRNADGHMAVRQLGSPRRDLVAQNGVRLVRRALKEGQIQRLSEAVTLKNES